MIELLKQDGITDPWHFIRFYSLRNHGQSPVSGLPTDEMIYIHSKAMIVDDRYFIIGSANVNDRSMLGSRDHEIAVLVKFDPNSEHDIKEVKFAGKNQ